MKTEAECEAELEALAQQFESLDREGQSSAAGKKLRERATMLHWVLDKPKAHERLIFSEGALSLLECVG